MVPREPKGSVSSFLHLSLGYVGHVAWRIDRQCRDVAEGEMLPPQSRLQSRHVAEIRVPVWCLRDTCSNVVATAWAPRRRGRDCIGPGSARRILALPVLVPACLSLVLRGPAFPVACFAVVSSAIHNLNKPREQIANISRCSVVSGCRCRGRGRLCRRPAQHAADRPPPAAALAPERRAVAGVEVSTTWKASVKSAIL